MPLEQTEAIVLKAQSFADQDKLVTFFSRDRGLIRGIAKGARKFGNRFGSSLEPLSVVRVFYYEKECKDLVTISNCDLVESFFEMQNDPDVSFTAAYFAELIEEFFPTRAGENTVFRLLLSTLQAMKAGADRVFASRYFEAWFLQINGLLPDFKRCKKCRRPVDEGWLAPKKDGIYCRECADYQKEETHGELQKFLDWVKKNPPLPGTPPPFSAAELETIRLALQSIIIYHMEKEPKSLAFIQNHKA